MIQTAYLGDLVLTLPLLARLAEQAGPVDVVTTPGAAAFLIGQPAVRRIIPFDKRDRDRGARGLIRLAAALSAGRYGRAVLPHRSLRSALLAILAGIPVRVGFSAGGLPSLLYTVRIPWPEGGAMADRLRALAGPPPMGDLHPPWLSLPSGARTRAAGWLEDLAVGEGFVVVAPGAHWATKRWPHYPGLVRLLERPIVVVGGAEDTALGAEILRNAPPGSANAAGVLSLPESAAIIAGAAAVVCNDSVALHLAVALGRPVVVVAGPTGPTPCFAPPSQDDRVVAHPSLACRPCSTHGQRRCPLGHHRCMTELAPATVARALAERLAVASSA